jgi:alpha-N-arabinofuranosidase
MKSLLVSLMTLFAICTQAAGAEPVRGVRVDLVVDTDHPGPRIDRNIFGQFTEHLGSGIYGGIWVGKESTIPNVRGIRSDVVAALRALKVPNVRWPGGCFADEYHWRNGIGPADKRSSSINANWGGAIETNHFGTHEFMDFIEQIGSQAYISANVGSGTPREASEWLEYLTADTATSAGQERAANGHAQPYRVAFLGIGNESWGCGGAMTPDYYVSQLKIFSRYVRNYNPSQTGEEAMRRIAVGPDGANTDYTEAVMKAWHDRVWSWNIEGLSLHAYTTGGWPPRHASVHFDESEYALILKEALEMDALIARHAAIMDRYDPEKRIPLVVDEWGVWLAPLPGTNPGFLVQQNSLRDALLAALNLNIFARHAERVHVANIAQMVNVLQAMVMTDQERIVLTPSYHVFRMYVPFQDATFIPVRIDAGTYSYGPTSLPRVDAIAARDAQGAIWVALTNVDPRQPVQVGSVVIAGIQAHSARGEVLSGAHVDSVNSFEVSDAVAPKAFAGTVGQSGVTMVLPPKSLVVVQLKP